MFECNTAPKNLLERTKDFDSSDNRVSNKGKPYASSHVKGFWDDGMNASHAFWVQQENAPKICQQGRGFQGSGGHRLSEEGLQRFLERRALVSIQEAAVKSQKKFFHC